jgi:hypothetical protein
MKKVRVRYDHKNECYLIEEKSWIFGWSYVYNYIDKEMAIEMAKEYAKPTSIWESWK